MSTKSHVKGDCLFYNKGKNYIANIIAMGYLAGKKILIVCCCFLLLKQGCLFIDFEAMKVLVIFLKVKNTPKKLEWKCYMGDCKSLATHYAS